MISVEAFGANAEPREPIMKIIAIIAIILRLPILSDNHPELADPIIAHKSKLLTTTPSIKLVKGISLLMNNKTPDITP